MGIVQDSRAAVGRYEEAANATALAGRDLLARLDAVDEQLSPAGALGSTADPDLARARGLLAAARVQLRSATEAATASARAARGYIDQALPG